MADANGKKTGGRTKGTPNKITTTAKEAIALAAQGIGGTDRLIAWVKEDEANEKVFWSQMYTKLLPHQVEGGGENGEIIFQTVYEAK
jgi:hypothetical protein